MLPRPKYGTSTWYRWRGSAAVHAGGRGDRMTPVHTMKYTKIVCFEQGSQNEGFRQNCGRGVDTRPLPPPCLGVLALS